MSKFYEDLIARNIIYQTTGENAIKGLLDHARTTVYVGFDATAPSLHVGSLFQLITLSRFQRAGHRCIVLLGGATTKVGDPSGRNKERPIMAEDAVKNNAEAIKEQIARILADKSNPIEFVNNEDWSSDSFKNYLDDVGCFPVSDLLSKDSIRQRLENGGLAFAEFNYALMQARDFLHLFRTERCQIQLGGSDQWGNITVGTELIRRLTGERAHGMTLPLVMTSQGHKMGKSESGAVWLDAFKTRVFDFYQHWYRSADDDLYRFSAWYTDLDLAAYEALCQTNVLRAKEMLAYQVTKRVHGEAEANAAMAASRAAYYGEGNGEAHLPIHVMTNVQPIQKLLDILTSSGLTPSKSSARRLIEAGGVYVNEQRQSDTEAKVDISDSIILRVGRKRIKRIMTER